MIDLPKGSEEPACTFTDNVFISTRMSALSSIRTNIQRASVSSGNEKLFCVHLSQINSLHTKSEIHVAFITGRTKYGRRVI
jgi:hypothetical protein